MITVNALGDTCPIPVVKAKNAIRELNGAGQVEVLVDNEIAVQNLKKLAEQKGYGFSGQQLEARKYRVLFTVEENGALENQVQEPETAQESCPCGNRRNVVVAVSSSRMGEGDEQLGNTLMKAFLYALTQQDELPQTILFYNGGARLTCEDSPAIEDLKQLESEGVEILTCGTCLDYYGLKEQLRVGGVTNMYVIAEKMTQAEVLVKP